jgi:rRNA maturation protein Rpf1
MDYLNHSLFKSNKQKHVRFSRDVLSVIDGANTLAHMNMNNWRMSYEQHFQTIINIKENTYNQEINYGGLGTQITLLVIKVAYESTLKNSKLIREPEVPYLEYVFANNMDEVRTLDNILILSGTKDKKLPKILLSNPNKSYKAKVEIIACTTDIHADELKTLVQLNDKTFDIYDLEYKNLLSDDSGSSIIIQRDVNMPIASFTLERIANIELNGKLMSIDDTALGKINLFFKDQFNCLQAYSLINWVMADTANNSITYNMLPDIEAPTVIYNTDFSTTINLLEYEVCSTCDHDKYLITKDDLISLLINKVVDNRDGAIYIDGNNIILTKVNQNIPKEAITEGGKYNCIVDVTDMAGNRKTDVFVLTIKDGNGAKIVLGDLGYDLYNSALNGVYPSASIFVDDFTNKTITKQDILDLCIERVFDDIDGVIPVITNNIKAIIRNDSFDEVNNIKEAGMYTVEFSVKDSHENVTSVLYYEGVALELTFINMYVQTNQAPQIMFNNIQHLYLFKYNNFIDKTTLKNILISSIVDDRDVLTFDNILNVSIYKTHNGVDGIGEVLKIADDIGYYFNTIVESEVIAVHQRGIYRISMVIADKNGAISVNDIEIVMI